MSALGRRICSFNFSFGMEMDVFAMRWAVPVCVAAHLHALEVCDSVPWCCPVHAGLLQGCT